MKAYVISLPRSTERRASIEQQLARTDLEFELVDGVDGHGLTSAERAELVSEAAVARHPRWLTPGLIGAALSHRRVYQRVNGDVGLVLEDDAIVPAGVAGTCNRVASHMDGREVVLLYFRAFDVCRFSAQDVVELGAGRRLMYPISPGQPIGAVAYLITAEASRSLADAIVPVRAGADSWGQFSEWGAIESLRCVLPRVAGHRNDFKSTIDYTEGSPVRRLVSSRAALAPFRTLNRARIERRMSRTAVVPERSPIAVSRR